MDREVNSLIGAPRKTVERRRRKALGPKRKRLRKAASCHLKMLMAKPSKDGDAKLQGLNARNCAR